MYIFLVLYFLLTTVFINRFKWAELQIQELCRYVVEEQVEDALSNEISPLDALNDIYSRMFKFIQTEPSTNRNIAFNLIKLVMAAERPLQSDEACALAIADLE